MTLLFTEGFDWSTTNTHQAYKWGTTFGASSITTGRFTGSNCVIMSTTTLLKQGILGTVASGVVGFALKWTSGAQSLLSLVDSTNTIQIDIALDSTGHFLVRRNGVTTLLTTTNAIFSVAWYYVELKFLISDTVGTLDIHVDGVTWGSATGLDTKQSTETSISSLGLYNTSSLVAIDDLYFLDLTGSVNNDFLGDVRIETVYPTGAGATSGFTPSAGSNFQNVDDGTNPDDDTTYNSASSVGTTDTYATGNLTSGVGTIKAVVPNIVARKDDAGTRSIAPVIRQSSTDYAGTGQPLSSSYLNYRQIYETNPATGLAWTISDVNADEFGVKVSA